MKGTLMFVLHSHIPYVRKSGKFPFGEEWVYEAILDSYLPLIDALQRLQRKNIKAGLTVGLTPVLLMQLKDPYMIEEFIKYTKQRISFAKSDCKRFSDNSQLEEAQLAENYCQQYEYLLNFFTSTLKGDLVSAFKELQDKGLIEIITSAFSHGYLPLLKNPNSVKLQLELGIESYQHSFSQAPAGIWLPECAYKPGLDNFLAEYGLKYFITDSHAIIGGRVSSVSSYGAQLNTPFTPTRPYTTFQPYQLRSGVAVLGRNLTTGGQVWSADFGYPGEACYREFHKRHQNSGLQYWQITGKQVPLHEKGLYNRRLALDKVLEHVTHFSSLAEHLLESYFEEEGAPGVILSPYDTELFGHWWHEGVTWLEKTIELVATKKVIKLSTVKEHLETHPPNKAIDLPESSWGAGGKHDVWLNENTSWVWDLIYKAEDKFWKHPPQDLNFSNPVVKELLLLQSSDWPFLITTGQAREYAAKRVLEHWENLNKLIES